MDHSEIWIYRVWILQWYDGKYTVKNAMKQQHPIRLRKKNSISILFFKIEILICLNFNLFSLEIKQNKISILKDRIESLICLNCSNPSGVVVSRPSLRCIYRHIIVKSKRGKFKFQNCPQYVTLTGSCLSLGMVYFFRVSGQVELRYGSNFPIPDSNGSLAHS